MFVSKVFYDMCDELDIPSIPLFKKLLKDHEQRNIQLPKLMPSVWQTYSYLNADLIKEDLNWTLFKT